MSKHTPDVLRPQLPYPKLCECGCGEPAPIAKRNNSRLNHVKGQPVRFIPGHSLRNRPERSAEERFWEKVDKRGPTDCWEWQGSRDAQGYGSFRFDGHTGKAYRFSFALHNGPIPDGMFVCHNCPGGDRPSCVNPAHLWLGTPAENTADMRAKGNYSPPPVHRDKGEKAPNARLTDAEVREIRRQYSIGKASIRAFAHFYDMSPMGMWKILKGISYPNA